MEIKQIIQRIIIISILISGIPLYAQKKSIHDCVLSGIRKAYKERPNFGKINSPYSKPYQNPKKMKNGLEIGGIDQLYPYYNEKTFKELDMAYYSNRKEYGSFRLQDVMPEIIDFSRIKMNMMSVKLVNNKKTGFIELWVYDRYFLNLYGDEAVDILKMFVAPNSIGYKSQKLHRLLLNKGGEFENKEYKFNHYTTRWRDATLKQQFPIYNIMYDSLDKKDYNSPTFGSYKRELSLPVGVYLIEKEPYMPDDIDNFSIRIDNIEKDSCVFLFVHIKGEYEGRLHILKTDILNAKEIISILWGTYTSNKKKNFLKSKLSQLGFEKRTSKETVWVDWTPEGYMTEEEQYAETAKKMGLTVEEFNEVNLKLFKAAIYGVLAPTPTLFQTMGLEP